MRNSLLLVPLLVACSAPGPAPEPAAPAPAPVAEPAAEPAASAPAGEHLSPPFSAAELRAGLPEDTEIKLRVETAGQPTVIENWLVIDSTDEECTIAARILAEDGSVIKDEGSGTSTWAELESHAHFPAARTTRSESSVTVPAGTFETWYFEVQPEAAGGPVKRLHFAKELPGPPVSMEVEQDGAVVTKMVLVMRSQPTEQQ